MTSVSIYPLTGVFAENKDIAREIRVTHLEPALNQGQSVEIDFTKVDGATQSFVHALISELFRRFGNEVLDRIEFKGCNGTVKQVITIVADYMQEAGQ